MVSFEITLSLSVALDLEGVDEMGNPALREAQFVIEAQSMHEMTFGRRVERRDRDLQRALIIARPICTHPPTQGEGDERERARAV